MNPHRPLAAAVLISLFGAVSVQAHSPFLRPGNFAPARDWVTVTGGMHEETALLADFALRPGDFWETRPDGTTVKLEAASQTKGLTVVDAPLPTPGTYRISTGARAGRETTWAQVDGAWRMVRAPGARERPAEGAAASGGVRRPEAGREGPGPIDTIPDGAPVVHSTGFLRADTYVSRNAPSSGGWAPSGQGMEIAPVTNPTDVYLDKGLTVRVLVNGAPVAGAKILARRGDESYADKKSEMSVVTDAQGAAHLRFPLPGAWVLETRTPPSPPGGRPPERTDAATLTIEASL